MQFCVLFSGGGIILTLDAVTAWPQFTQLHSAMEVKNEMTERRGGFYIEDQGLRVGTMTYRFTGPGRLTIDHTVVNPGNEGKGLGRMLVQAAVEFARQHGYKIEPLCPYAKSVFDKTPEYGDVLK